MRMHAFGEPDALSADEADDPKPGPGQVLIDVRAIGVNFFDILICQGKYQSRPPFPFSPGAEVAGEVLAVGDGVDRVQVGQRVLALLSWGGYASRAIADEGRTFVIPDAMDFDTAAAFGIVYQTSYFGLVERAALARGETLLVHAAAGGVGLAAVQIGRALGARVLGTASSEEKRALIAEHGGEPIDYTQTGWVERVKELTDGRGADVIYDPVGGDVFSLSTKCIAFEGRLVVIGFASGQIPELKMNRVLLKNIAVTGLYWGAYIQHDPARIDRAMDKLFSMFVAGDLPVHIGARMPLTKAAEALHQVARRKVAGKMVLSPQ